MCFQDPPNRLKHAVYIIYYIVVPETNDAVTMSGELCRSVVIQRFLFGMLTAINFHDQVFLHANEVDHVVPDWSLPAEFVTVELAIP